MRIMRRMVDLGLNTVPTRGRRTKPVRCEVEKELTQEDLALMREEKGIKPPALKRLSQRHFALAKAISMGAKPR